MSTFKFLDVQLGEKPLRFQMLRSVARQNYVSARVAFMELLVEPACLLAHQSIEMILKAIIALNYQEKWGRDLVAIVQSNKTHVACANQILNNSKMSYFMENLVNAYGLMR